QIAQALGGIVSGGEVRAPGPGHSKDDRSLCVKLSRDGKLLVNSFAGDDWQACADYVRERCGMPAFKPNGAGKRKAVRTLRYDYCDPATGEFRYHKERIEYDDGSKSLDFPAGRGRPGMGRNGHDPLLFGGERLAGITGEGQPVWIVEGEKQVLRMRELGAF